MDDKILNLLVELKEGQTSIVSRLDTIDSRLDTIDSRLDNLESQLGSVVSETANLMEFRTDITDRVDNLKQKYNFQTHKLTKTEEDIFEIKSHLKIVK